MLKEYLKELEQLSDVLRVFKHPGKMRVYIDKNLSPNDSHRRYEEISIYYNPNDPVQKELSNKLNEHYSEMRRLFIELGELRKTYLREKIMKETE